MSGNDGFDAWASEVAHELVKLGVPMLEARNVPYDNEAWFRREFDGGEGAAMTALEWHNHNG